MKSLAVVFMNGNILSYIGFLLYRSQPRKAGWAEDQHPCPPQGTDELGIMHLSPWSTRPRGIYGGPVLYSLDMQIRKKPKQFQLKLTKKNLKYKSFFKRSTWPQLSNGVIGLSIFLTQDWGSNCFGGSFLRV